MNYIREGTGKRDGFLVYDMKEFRGEEVQLHSFFTSTADGGEWLTLRSGLFTSGKEPRYVKHVSFFLFDDANNT